MNEERSCLSVSQDIIHYNSNGRKMPTSTYNKNPVLRKRHHHNVKPKWALRNYWKSLEIDTACANDICSHFTSSDGYYKTIIPPNIVQGCFVQSATDNSDDQIDTLTRKASVNIMSTSYFQSGTMLPTERLVLSQPPKQPRNKARSLNITEIKLRELKANIKLARPPFIKKVTKDILTYSLTDREQVNDLNMAWVFLRNTPTKLLQVNVNQLVPGWSGFHATVTSKLSVPTQIGYAPFIPYSVKDANTMFTCTGSLNDSFKIHLRQENPVVTFDEDLYATAKQNQWTVSPEFDDMVLRLGGFHKAKIRTFLTSLAREWKSEVLKICGLSLEYMEVISQGRLLMELIIIELETHMRLLLLKFNFTKVSVFGLKIRLIWTNG